jgi:ABC-type Fe3+ transport system substrate-binding protein
VNTLTAARKVLSCFAFVALQALLFSAVNAQQATVPHAQNWDGLLKAAENEGQVTVYVHAAYRRVVEQFSAVYPKIKLVTSVGAGGPEIASRLMAERRAGKHLADVYIVGMGTHIQILHPAKALAAIPPAIVLPEVQDESKWFGARHDYLFPKEGYSFIFEKNVAHWISYNTKWVKADEIKSWWDIVNPKWRGKIVGYDPTIPGAAAPSLWYFYKNPALGAKFIEHLYGKMELVLSRDPRQLWDWLATGKAAICIACKGWSTKLEEQALPIDKISYSLKEGAFMPYGNGIVSLIQPTPHPSAAKVFINWLLSRRGQTVFQEISAREGDPRNSARIDIPKDTVPEEEIPKPGASYLAEGRDSTEERKEAIKIFRQVMPNR